MKPILVKSVDGGPDENPRFYNNIVMGCKTFHEMGLDCYIEVTNAPVQHIIARVQISTASWLPGW